MEKSVLYSGKFLRFCKRGKFEFIERMGCTGIVVIVAITDTNEIVLTEQYRAAVDKNVIELPAGLVGDIHQDESLELAAERELLEETGFQAGRVERLLEGPISSGMSTEIVTFFRALDLTKVHSGGGDEDENITVHTVPLATLDSYLETLQQRGLYVDPKIYIGKCFAL